MRFSVKTGQIVAVQVHQGWSREYQDPIDLPTSAERDSDQAAITEVVEAFESTWNRHDMPAFAALFALNADFVNVVGMWWKNSAEIEAAHVHSHSTFLRDSTLTGKVEKIKFLGPDIATIHVHWELKGQIEPDGSVGRPRHGVLLLVMKRNGEQWLIQTAQNTDIVAGVLTRAAK